MDTSMINLIEFEAHLKNPDQISLYTAELPLQLSPDNVPSALLSLSCIHIILKKAKKDDQAFRDYLLLLPQYFEKLVALAYTQEPLISYKAMSVLSDLCRLNGPSMNINTSQLYTILRQNLLQEGGDSHKLDSLQLFKNQFSRWDPTNPDGEATKVLACLREDNWGILNLLHTPNPRLGYMLMSLINLIFKKANSEPLTSQYWIPDRTLIASNPSFHKFIGSALSEGAQNPPTLRKVLTLLNSSLAFFGSHCSFIVWCFDLLCTMGTKLFQQTNNGQAGGDGGGGGLSIATLNQVRCCYVVLLVQFVNQNVFDPTRNIQFIPIIQNYITTLPSLGDGISDLFSIFSSHDDLLISLCYELLMFYTHAKALDSSSQVYGLVFSALAKLQPNQQTSTDTLLHSISPIMVFDWFTNSIGYDHTVLLEFLISCETSFLKYFVCFLKHLLQEWNQNIKTKFDDLLSMLVRLSLALQKLTNKQIFPYNITPVLKKLQTVETLFEENPDEYKPTNQAIKNVLPPPSGLANQDGEEQEAYDEINQIVFHFGKWSLGGDNDNTHD